MGGLYRQRHSGECGITCAKRLKLNGRNKRDEATADLNDSGEYSKGHHRVGSQGRTQNSSPKLGEVPAGRRGMTKAGARTSDQWQRTKGTRQQPSLSFFLCLLCAARISPKRILMVDAEIP